MYSVNQVLSTPLTGRSHKLQSLLRHFLDFNSSLIEEIYSLTRSSNIDFALVEHKPGQIQQGRSSEISRTDWSTFPNLSHHKQEKLLEDWVVVFFRKICDNGKKTVLIQCDSTRPENSKVLNFCGSDIVEVVRRAGFNSWLVDTQECNETCLSLDKALLERMNFVSLILVGPYGLTLDYNKDTKTFKLPYMTAGPPEEDRSILLNDFFYVPNHRTTDSLFERNKQSVPLPLDLTRHRRIFTAIPVGNLKTNRIRKARRSIRPEDRNKILFFAEAYDYANSIAKDYGVILIQKILDRFPNNSVVYRPHPSWVDHPISSHFRQAFADEQRFIFDTNSSSEVVMTKGCALITDGSVSGLTYCLSASRPAIYFNPFQLTRHFDPNVMGFNFENGELFRFTATIDETLDALEDLVADTAKEFEEITAIAKKAYAHPDDGMEYFLSSIQAIVENRTLSDWKSFEISDNEIGDESARYYAGLIKNDLIFVHHYPRVLKKDLSELDSDHVVTGILKNYFHDIHRITHLGFILANLNAVTSSIEEYGCSRTAIELIDPLLAPIITRGNSDELGNAIDMLQKAYRRILGDAENNTDGSHYWHLFQSTLAGTIQSKFSDLSKITEQELYEIRSLTAEYLLAPDAPKALISNLQIINNDSCELTFSCVTCETHHTMRDIQFWFSYKQTCKTCGTVNLIDPFDKALHRSDVFFAQLPQEGNVVLWGAGGFYYKLMQAYEYFSSDRFILIDAKKTQHGLIICKKKVHSPDDILHKNIRTIIITALNRKDEIYATLRDNYPSVEYILVPALDITPEGVVPFLKSI